MNAQNQNPYIGPRTFRKEESHLFFGRDREARDLAALVTSERLVLFYAQSGAGKSSLINTRLIPDLEEKLFEVLPTARVSGDTGQGTEVDNIYVYNLIRSLVRRETDARLLSRLTLPQFLAKLNEDKNGYFYDTSVAISIRENLKITPWRRALVIDQFEEIVSTHPEAWQKREDFFRQLADAMRADSYLWVILVMREDYVAALDPYAHLLPGQLRTRYYMQRMGVQSALDAIRKPVENIRPFERGVPELLVNNMRLIGSTKVPGQPDQLLYGEFIEPVQLQVVCYQLWERIQKFRRITSSAPVISRNDLVAIARGENITQFISNSLADFYEQAIAKVLADPEAKIQESDLRDWFNHKLITEAETRGFVYRGAESTAGLPNRAVDILASQYIIRSESRAGGVWVELVHDRFISPILQANRKWAEQNQKSVLTDAIAWDKEGRPDSLLYDGKQLESSSAELETHPDRLAPLEKEFIRASQRAAMDRLRRSRVRLGIGALIVLLVVAALSISNIYSANELAAQATIAQINANQADQNIQFANAIRLATSQAQNAELYQAVITTQDAEIATLQALASPQPTETAVEATAVSGDSTTAVESSLPTLVFILSTPTALGPINEEVIGYSVNNQAIRAFKFGSGPRHVVLIGGLHAGFAPSTVKVAEEMRDYFAKNLDLIPASLTLDIITVANPDSWSPSGNVIEYAGKRAGRLNANGVDLNRNWDCDWRKEAVWRDNPISGGIAPFSESETKALRDFFIRNQLTVAVIIWEAMSIDPSVSPGGCGDFSVYSDPLSRLYADSARYKAHDFVAYDVNGDATNWLDSQGIGAVTVLLRSYTELSSDDVEANINAVKQVLRVYGR